ncbi:MAG: NuoI/complex I 23 kDa subunit family protein [Bacteriovoracaceae bacterium]
MLLNKDLYKHHGYLKGLYLALKITIITMFKNILGLEKRMTLNYPEEKYFYSDRFKGKHVLTLKEDGSLRCTSCMLCATACPADCIHIIAADHEDKEVEKAPVAFEIELLRCVFCGMCEEACPVDAIRLTNEYTMSGFAERDWLIGIPELSQRSTLNNGKGIISTVDDHDRLKIKL